MNLNAARHSRHVQLAFIGLPAGREHEDHQDNQAGQDHRPMDAREANERVMRCPADYQSGV